MILSHDEQAITYFNFAEHCYQFKAYEECMTAIANTHEIKKFYARAVLSSKFGNVSFLEDRIKDRIDRGYFRFYSALELLKVFLDRAKIDSAYLDKAKEMIEVAYELSPVPQEKKLELKLLESTYFVATGQYDRYVSSVREIIDQKNKIPPEYVHRLTTLSEKISHDVKILSEQDVLFYENTIQILKTKKSDSEKLEILRMLSITHPESRSWLFMMKAELAMQSDLIFEAQTAFLQAKIHSPFDADLDIRMARLWKQKNDFEKSWYLYENAMNLMPTDLNLLNEALVCAQAMNDYEKGLFVFNRLDNFNYKNIYWDLKKADFFMALRRHEEAIDTLRIATEKNPNEARLFLALAQIATQMQLDKQATAKRQKQNQELLQEAEQALQIAKYLQADSRLIEKGQAFLERVRKEGEESKK